MIHTTIGVYSNWRNLGDNGYKINGVPSERLEDHVEYNKTFRFGRALFVDGKCIYKGQLPDKDVEELELLFNDNKFKRTQCTAPYN